MNQKKRNLPGHVIGVGRRTGHKSTYNQKVQIRECVTGRLLAVYDPVRKLLEFQNRRRRSIIRLPIDVQEKVVYTKDK